MESQDPRNPKLAIGRTMTETALRDDDDPWSGGSSDMTSAQDDHDAFDSGPSRVVHGSRSVEPPTAGDAQAFTGSSLVGDPQALRRQWESVQVGFVDDPRRAVEDAERLVSMAVEELVDNFLQQRQALETSWSQASDRSVNELRQAFQRYRDFFERLLQI